MTRHAAVLRARDAELELEAGGPGRPCHLCHALTLWQRPGVGPTCDTCAPLVEGALRLNVSVRAALAALVGLAGRLPGGHPL